MEAERPPRERQILRRPAIERIDPARLFPREHRRAGTTDTHRKYLERVGFRPSATDADLYELTL